MRPRSIVTLSISDKNRSFTTYLKAHHMNSYIKYCTVGTGIFLFALSVSTALADAEPNGNYSYAEISLGKSTFANPICIGTECHTGLGGLGLDVAYQVIPNIAISLNSGASQSTGSQYTLKSSGGGLYIAFIAGIGSALDVAAILGSLSSTTQVCTTSSNVCSSASDTGSDFGLYGKLWLNESKNINVGLGFENYSYSKSTTKYTTAVLSMSAIPADNHEFDFTVSNTKDSNGQAVSSAVSLGYKYLFDHGRPRSRIAPAEARNPETIQDIPVQQPTPTEQIKPANSVSNDSAQKLRELNTLKNEGVITDSEYQLKKKQLLEKY